MSTALAIAPASLTPMPSAAARANAASSDNGRSFFSDLLDIVNPLQHLPVVSTLYRALTGEGIDDVARVAGDTLYGGVIGLGSSLANIGFRELTGKDVGDTVLAFAEDVTGLKLGTSPDAAPSAFAQAAPAAANVAALTNPVPNVDQGEEPASVQAAQAVTLPAFSDGVTLLSNLRAEGIDPVQAMRALTAYGRSLVLTGP